jgi:hypothetical protein
MRRPTNGVLTAIILLLSITASSVAAAPKSPPKPASVLLIMVDYSGSTALLNPPHTMQASVVHLVNLAEFSGQPVAIAVVFFGQGGVRVVGDKGGMPTLAYAALRQELLGSWPKPAGETPMDEAFQATLKLARTAPRGAPISVVLMSDGQPESGRLRPQDFPEIAQEMARHREAVVKKYQGFPPEILQHYLRQLEAEWSTPGTEAFKQLYDRQVRAEFQTTLQHAAALAKEKVRFVTVDFGGGIPQLREIHQAAAGADRDLVATSPNAVTGKLHELGLTALPRVVLAPVQFYDAQSDSFDRSIELLLDPIADRGMLTVEFSPAIPDFASQAFLKARVDGSESAFTLGNTAPQRLLALDAKGNVATATLLLDAIPKDGRVTIQFQSPKASLHVPGCTVYTYLRLPPNVSVAFRPSTAEAESLAPHRVSASHAVAFTCALRTEAEPKPYPLRSMEAVLLHTGSRQPVRLDMHPDPASPGAFTSDEVTLTPGCYDVETHIVLPSGAKFSLTLPRQLESQLRDEAVAVEVLQPLADSPEATKPLGSIAFEPVGDEITTRSLVVVLRSLEIDYPLTLVPSVTLADPQGTVPRQQWISFDKPRVVLQPGRAEPLRLTLALPKEIEEAIRDSRFEGKLSLMRTDTHEPVPLRRYRKISGVPDDEPVEQITFTLARPRLLPSVWYALRNRLKVCSDDRIECRVNVSIGQPFQRRVTIQVSHQSVLARSVTVLASGAFTDANGRYVPQVRLTPIEAAESTLEIAPGQTGCWEYEFAMDEGCGVDKAFGTLDILSPGLQPQRISVVTSRRNPLLEARVRLACALLIGISLLLAVRALYRRLRAGRLRTGAQHVLTPQRPLAGLLSLEVGRQGTLHVISSEPMTVQGKEDYRPKLIPARRPAIVGVAAVNPARPLALTVQPAGGRPACEILVLECLSSPDGEPELYVEVSSGEEADREMGRQGRVLRRCLGLAVVCAIVAVTLHYPLVLAAAQWVYDAIPIS